MAIPSCGHFNHLPHHCSPPHQWSSVHPQTEQDGPPPHFWPLQDHPQVHIPPIGVLIMVWGAKLNHVHEQPTLWPPMSLRGSHYQAWPPPRHLPSASFVPRHPLFSSSSVLQPTSLPPFAQPLPTCVPLLSQQH